MRAMRGILSTTILFALSFLSSDVTSAPSVAVPPSDLQRREIVCNPYGLPLTFFNCFQAIHRIPTIAHPAFVLERPLTRADFPHTAAAGNCKVTFDLAPGVEQTPALWSTLQLRAVELVSRCVGGWGLAPVPNDPGHIAYGRGGNDTVDGVMIGVSGRV